MHPAPPRLRNRARDRRLILHSCKEQRMDKEHVKGAADKVSGATKEAVGKVTGNEKLVAEGKLDKAKGAAHDALGDAKDAAKKKH
jgi:uncharacterized protein YjbJ (UPF0337 family)